MLVQHKYMYIFYFASCLFLTFFIYLFWKKNTYISPILVYLQRDINFDLFAVKLLGHFF